MRNPTNNITAKEKHFIMLAFEQAKINLGSTNENPSVGCVIEQNGSIISSGCTSRNGRPHAEQNALKNNSKKFSGSNIYLSMEPCNIKGKTRSCTKLIFKKKIKKVIFSSNDHDFRTKDKAKKFLSKNGIRVKEGVLKKFGTNFYKYHFIKHNEILPYLDGKIAISKDYYTISKNSKWITNQYSRKRVQLLRSNYDCLLTTSKTINDDNPMLSVRIEGLEKKSPAIAIYDRFFKIKKNLKIVKEAKNRKMYLFIHKRNKSREIFFKKKGFKIFALNKGTNKDNFEELLKTLKRKNFSRIFLESGLKFLSFILNGNYINNLYVFKSNKNLKKYGVNNINSSFLKKIKLKRKINVNLLGDNLYKVEFNYV